MNLVNKFTLKSEVWLFFPLIFFLLFFSLVKANQLSVTDGDTIRIGDERIRFQWN